MSQAAPQKLQILRGATERSRCGSKTDHQAELSRLLYSVYRDNLAVFDYELLDEIPPSLAGTLKEWMRKTGYDGECKPVLVDVVRGDLSPWEEK